MSRRKEIIGNQTKRHFNQLLGILPESEQEEVYHYIERISVLDKTGNDLNRNQVWGEFESNYPEIAQLIMGGWQASTPAPKPRRRGSRFYP